MKCMNCGAELTDSAYCPNCGCDVSVQKQAIVLSGIYYNQGLEKAQVRDLSGAMDQLRRSLKFNKMNIDARNLLGLVYFETGEVVSALSEWVISKNMQPENNAAAGYIRNLQQDANRLDVINQTIKKYNFALQNAVEGNEDTAVIQLKKLLTQNPKLIKGYQLLALLYIHKGEYEKARRQLKRAIKIDKTNTTTLRFLAEVDEQTGTRTQLEPRRFPGIRRAPAEEASALSGGRRAEAVPAQTLPARTSNRFSVFNLIFGAVLGAAAIWFLVIPARTRAINLEANDKIAQYSTNIASYKSQNAALSQQLSTAQAAASSATAAESSSDSVTSSYSNLVKAGRDAAAGESSTAAAELQSVDRSLLDDDSAAVYDTLAAQLADYMTESAGSDASSAESAAE